MCKQRASDSRKKAHRKHIVSLNDISCAARQSGLLKTIANSTGIFKEHEMPLEQFFSFSFFFHCVCQSISVCFVVWFLLVLFLFVQPNISLWGSFEGLQDDCS